MSDKKHIRTFRSKKLHPEHVKTLNEAIRKNAKGGDYNVHIQYTKPDGTKSERKIKPLGVKDKSLLLAHCHERNAIRSFRVERVSMVKQAFWDGFDPWGTKKKQADLLEKKKLESIQQEKDKEDYLLGHIKKQKLEEHLKVLDHPKADQRHMVMEEIIRRHGDPFGVVRTNPGGDSGHGPYHPNYSDKYWERIGGKVDKDKKYMTTDQRIERRRAEAKMEKSAFWDGFEKRSATRSEILGSIPTGPAAAIGLPLGVMKGPYTDEEQREVNKNKWSNLIPGVGSYRYGRRLTGIGMTNDEKKESRKFEKRAEAPASWSDAAPLVGAGVGSLGALHYAEKAKGRRIPSAIVAGLAGLGGHQAVKGIKDFVSRVKKEKSKGLPEDYETNPERYPNG